MYSIKPLKVSKIGLVAKYHQADAALMAKKVAQYLIDEFGLKVYYAKENAKSSPKLTGKLAKQVTLVPKKNLPEKVDFIIVIGGDGTYLGIARHMHKNSVPILGINMGQLGFLTEFKKEECFQAIKQVLKSKTVTVSERALFEVTLKRKNKVVFRGPVVNDAVVSKGAIARIINMELKINGQWVNNVRADGLIISTPTGSTAYALAAGGPILVPGVPAMIVAPICPHSLTQRPIVISNESTIRIRLLDYPGQTLLTLDGQDAFDMREGDVITIKKFQKHKLQVIASESRDYYQLLREKFKFGMRE